MSTKEIRIYVEGGGDGKDTKASFRQGFSKFLEELKNKAREKCIQWNIIACGPRDEAFRCFRTALGSHPNAFNVLLVDSEESVTSSNPQDHLQKRDSWDIPSLPNEHFHLMVQTMEAWIIADKEALKEFYGQNLYLKSLPNNQDVEQIDKSILESSLKQATRNTNKGEYHKIRHAPQLLALLNVSHVRQSAPHCNQLFVTLLQQLE